jgi:gamma-glutamylcyclotransferase (GGCT)/AIG2-like uncharacterized protein YtfP
MASMPGTALFVYGTLMDGERVRTLTGRSLPSRPARLEGYERIVPAGGYPYVVARTGRHVDGLLLEDVDDGALRALDRYEDKGRLYVRRAVEVIVEGRRVGCETYVGAEIRAARGRGRRSHRTSDG